MPRDNHQGSEIREDEDWILKHQIERRDYTRLHLLHITCHTGDNISLALFREEAEGQTDDFLIELIADIPDDTCTDRYHTRGCKEVGRGLQQGGHYQKDSNQQQCGGGTHLSDILIDIEIGVVDQHILHAPVFPRHQTRHLCMVACLEKNLQDRHQCGKREDIQQCRQDIEENRQSYKFLVGKDETLPDT